MSREAKLMKAAVAATGDASISDVAEFNPKGSAGASAAGAAAGSLAGGAATGGDGWGRSIGATGGLAAGRAMMGLSKDLPPRICVAVSPDEVYLLGMKAYGYHVDPIAKIHRDKLGVEIHQRVSVRTVVLEDLETGHKFPLEVKRLNFYHAKAMVELLMMSDAHHEEEIEEEHPEDAVDEG
ncbi:MAG: hypothetical protein U9R47_03580 [Actinomycetota bacterium]|nr:hypothetical protein [Actinomycetota bacterium]